MTLFDTYIHYKVIYLDHLLSQHWVLTLIHCLILFRVSKWECVFNDVMTFAISTKYLLYIRLSFTSQLSATGN
ncbi:hypothetical protein I7I50_02285 [Histoplasma capsulatum G186AR]|uniref:Uncharacterized protein n=1 Tax=Ajellomyces capsulatus TaxID=5037 RepID=A0A8H7Z7D4_AJECA|nr:hypothetical protein I7I52_01051 [Histoplasma capsulatum]QSS71451.1 hypothetical protein I7I50_02285 [Histoplasma capsulatum G186AR]